MKQVIYYLIYSGWYTISLLPLRVLYLFSDLLYYLLAYVVRYRHKIIYHNLRTSFPEKSPAEIDRTAKRFYAFFCDYIVETLKLLSISEREMRRRMRFEGLDEIEADFAQDRSVVVLLGHYGNWEWVSSLGLHLHEVCGQIYHPLENPYFERLFLHLRERFGAKCIDMESTFQQLYAWKKQGRRNIVGFISDQVPGYNTTHRFLDFLHHDTPVYSGGERIARLLDCTVYYLDVRRDTRGHYTATFRKITGQPADEPLFSITDRYFAWLEASIRREPHLWLWSHNRWKRTREEFNRIYSPEEARKRLSRL